MQQFNECFAKIKEDCFKYISSQETKKDRFINKDKMIKSFLLRVRFRIAKKVNKKNTLMIGLNAFYDHQLSESHERVGLGAEAISSIFDVRGNYYNSLSHRRKNSEGTIEIAMDGWDLRGDYHLPIDNDVRIFASLFEFENASGSFKLKGEKYGITGSFNNLNYEAGYIDDNKTGDRSFASIKYIISLGNKAVKPKPNGELIN